MKTHLKTMLLITFSTLNFATHSKENKPPKVAIIFVVDQFAYHYMNKIKPHLNSGLKHLLKDGINYTEAIFPHGMPSTPTGHAALSTGAYGYAHGITSYGYINSENKFEKIIDDSPEDAAVFSIEGTHDYGKSAKKLMVDTISDQFVLASEEAEPHHSYSISLKARSSILTAGQSGKAIWFDYDQGILTSSKAYFESLPDWLQDFNSKNRVRTGDQFTWKSLSDSNDKKYNYREAKNYKHSALKSSIVNQTFKVGENVDRPFEIYERTPFGHKLLFDAAQICLEKHLKSEENCRILLWISLSSFDLSSHYFGPDSFEQLDMVYHLDEQLKNFLNLVKTLVSEEETLLVLTADHGVMQIPEILNDKKFMLPKRISVENLMEEMNKTIENEYGIKDIVSLFEAPQFYLNKDALKESGSHQKHIIKRLKELVEAKPYIRHCWTSKELRTRESGDDEYKKLFAKQIYKDRGGELTCFLQPYQMLTKYGAGTSHATPYKYDLHVPLSIYQKNKFENTVVNKPISMLQLAGSLAKILNVSAPSACAQKLLPGLELT